MEICTTKYLKLLATLMEYETLTQEESEIEARKLVIHAQKKQIENEIWSLDIGSTIVEDDENFYEITFDEDGTEINISPKLKVIPDLPHYFEEGGIAIEIDCTEIRDTFGSLGFRYTAEVNGIPTGDNYDSYQAAVDGAIGVAQSLE
jgi:hypothetical protein